MDKGRVDDACGGVDQGQPCQDTEKEKSEHQDGPAKKGDLQKFCAERLQMAVNPNASIAQLQREAMRQRTSYTTYAISGVR